VVGCYCHPHWSSVKLSNLSDPAEKTPALLAQLGTIFCELWNVNFHAFENGSGRKPNDNLAGLSHNFS
jgi:hypothetical protein